LPRNLADDLVAPDNLTSAPAHNLERLERSTPEGLQRPTAQYPLDLWDERVTAPTNANDEALSRPIVAQCLA